MKKFLALCAGMMLVASAAMAQTDGLQLAWGGCANSPLATPAVDFDCDPEAGSLYTLYGTFTLGTPQANVVAVDNIIDFIFPNTPGHIPPFWHLEQGGCNGGGRTLTHIRPATICPTTNSIQLCGSGGGGCGSFISAYVFGAVYRLPENRSRMYMTIARPASLPTQLTAARHYMFGVNFFMDNAVSCAGCLDPIGITFNYAQFYNNVAGAGQEVPIVALESTDPGSTPSVGVNCVDCVTVSTKAKTWGQLKSLYR